MSRIEEIVVTPVGIIKSIVINDKCNPYKSIYQLKSDIKAGKIKLENAEITPNNTIKMNEAGFKNIDIKVEIQPVKRNTIQLRKIIYEDIKVEYVKEKVHSVKEVHIDTTSKETREILLTHGFTEIDRVMDIEGHLIFKLKIEGIWIKHLICKSTDYDKLFTYFGIDELSSNFNLTDMAFGVIYYLENKVTRELLANNTLQLEETTENKEKLKTWIDKAKLMGIYDNYELNEKQSTLFRCSENSQSLIPPVRYIYLHNYNGSNLVIPDTVERVDMIIKNRLKSIKLGKNVFSTNTGIFIGSHNKIKLVDTQNISCELNIDNTEKLIYRLQYGAKDQLNLMGHVDEIEIIENKI